MPARPTYLPVAAAGGPGAPDLNESLTNFAINSAALAALSWVFARDLRSQSRDRRVVEREEALARLQVTGLSRVLTGHGEGMMMVFCNHKTIWPLRATPATADAPAAVRKGEERTVLPASKALPITCKP